MSQKEWASNMARRSSVCFFVGFHRKESDGLVKSKNCVDNYNDDVGSIPHCIIYATSDEERRERFLCRKLMVRRFA